MAALVAGGLFAGNLALRAADTNAPAVPPPAGAPPGPRGGMRGGGPTLEQLTAQLNLTDDQKPKVKAILDDRDKKIQELRDSNPTPEDRRSKAQSIRQETSDALKAVLTDDQFKKYEEMTQRGRNRPGGGNPPPPANPPANPPAKPPQQ